jgi:hypothetical protein
MVRGADNDATGGDTIGRVGPVGGTVNTTDEAGSGGEQTRIPGYIYADSGRNGVAGGTAAEEGGQKRRRPRYVSPPREIEDEKPKSRGRGASGKSKSATASNGITAEICGYCIGGLASGISLALCGSLALATSEEQNSKLGGQLYNALETIPESTFTKVAVKVSPWMGLITGIVEVVFDKVKEVKRYQEAKAQADAELRMRNARATPVGAVEAPVPVEVPAPVPYPNEVAQDDYKGPTAPAPERDW